MEILLWKVLLSITLWKLLSFATWLNYRTTTLLLILKFWKIKIDFFIFFKNRMCLLLVINAKIFLNFYFIISSSYYWYFFKKVCRFHWSLRRRWFKHLYFLRSCKRTKFWIHSTTWLKERCYLFIPAISWSQREWREIVFCLSRNISKSKELWFSCSRRTYSWRVISCRYCFLNIWFLFFEEQISTLRFSDLIWYCSFVGSTFTLRFILSKLFCFINQ